MRWWAVQAIHENYRWRGVWKVLRAPIPEYVRINYLTNPPKWEGKRTWRLLMVDPDAILGWQMGLAEGVFI